MTVADFRGHDLARAFQQATVIDRRYIFMNMDGDVHAPYPPDYAIAV